MTLVPTVADGVSCSCGTRIRPQTDWYGRDGMMRAIEFAPGYKCSRTGPNSHGQHGMEIRWLLRGAKGVAQFVMFTDWPPSSPPTRPLPTGRRLFPMAADLGYHARVPQHEGQTAMGECDLLGAVCFYDGSGLNAEPVMERFFVEGDPAIWRALRHTYDGIEG